MINLNTFAKQIAEKESKKVQVNIAQIKEILRITLKLLNRYEAVEVLSLLKRISKTALVLAVFASSAWAWNPITDVRENLTWTFGKSAEAGIAVKLTGAGDLDNGDTATSALAGIADYRWFTFSYGGIVVNKADAKATDTFKTGLRLTSFFDWFKNPPTTEMQWMRNLNIGPALSVPVFARSHPVTLFLDFNYSFGNSVETK